MSDGKLSSPAALRNREPILALLREELPKTGLVLEIASGSGEHIVHYARQFQDLLWLPSDPSPEARASIAAWSSEERHDNLRAPIDIDASANEWPTQRADMIMAINMVHISPWAATVGLVKGAVRLLPAGGKLFLYGPYRQAGKVFVESNVQFDGWLKERNPDWGVRQLEEVVDLAKAHGLELVRVAEMPANNLGVIFKKT